MSPKLVALPPEGRWIILGLVAVYVIVRAVLYLTASSKPRAHLDPGTPREYGMGGGAICPNCQRPFALEILPIKIGFGTKLARCPYCGKWSLVRRASLAELRAAEAAEQSGAQPAAGKSEAEKEQQRIDDSRYIDPKG